MAVYYAVERSDAYLKHYGVKGMKWGIRRSPEQLGHKKEQKSPPNTKLLKNYSGKAYFVSTSSELKTLKPRVPDNYFTKNGYEDASTPRVCFAPSIDKCLAGLSQNLDGKKFTVYSPADIKKHSVYKPNKKAVPDSVITDEMWICEPVKLKKVGSVRITGNRGTDGKTFSYGKNKAVLYDDWTYEFKKRR